MHSLQFRHVVVVAWVCFVRRLRRRLLLQRYVLGVSGVPQPYLSFGCRCRAAPPLYLHVPEPHCIKWNVWRLACLLLPNRHRCQRNVVLVVSGRLLCRGA
jgi:hypothetical protein